MSLFQNILTPQLVHALGWSLLHSLWQGSLIAILLAGLLAIWRDHSPRLRYLSACFALLLIAIFAIATSWNIYQNYNGSAVNEATLQIDKSSAVAPALPSLLKPTPSKSTAGQPVAQFQQQPKRRLESALPILTAIWLLGVVIQILRLAGGLYQTERLKKRATRAVSQHWQTTLARVAKKLSINRSIQLLESALVTVPTVIGWLRPIILLPPSIFIGLSTEQLELIIAHELAHIRRHDYLVNLLQTLIETLFFYHPAVWWISRQIRIEREQACDDLVVAHCGNALIYARALTKMEHLRKTAPQLAVAANGGNLLQRIRRIVQLPAQDRQPSSMMAGTLIIAALVTLCCCLLATSRQVKLTALNSVAAAALPSGKAIEPEKNLFIDPHNQESEIAPLIARDNIAGENLAMRQIAMAALSGHAGTVIIMDPISGRVHTIVNQDWALRREWDPASTTKLVTTMAGLTEQLLDPTEQIKVSDRNRPIALTDALAYSDTQYFEIVADRIGAEHIINYARQFGFGELTGINCDNESAGHLPDYQSGINASHLGAYGEGIKVTPMQLAVMTSAIANGGAVVVPRVPRTEAEAAQFQTQIRRRLSIPATTYARLMEGMTAAVRYGTATGANDPQQAVAGKTGTIELKASGTGIGLFASYAPVNDPHLVVVVATKGKDEAGRIAAQIAGKIYRATDHR